MELPEFLLARIAEDEAVADKFLTNWREAGFSKDELSADFGLYPSKEFTEIGSGLGRFLAECEAKRRIVEWLPERTVLRLLALPYVGHPDYDEEWKP